MSSPAAVAHEGVGRLPFAHRVAGHFVPALWAGGTLGAIDAVRALRASAGPRAVFTVVTLAFFATTLTTLFGALLCAIDRRVADLGSRVSLVVWRAVAAAGVTGMLSSVLLAGTTVRRTWLEGGWPHLVTFTVALLAPWVVAFALGVARRHPRWLAAVGFVLAAAALAADHILLPRSYRALHVVFVLAAAASLIVAWRFVLPPRPWHAALGALGLVVTAIALGLLTGGVFCDDATRVFLVVERPIAGRVLAGFGRVFDVDGDGATGLARLSDCDDFDATRFVGAVDIPRNGRDEDCDGRDADAPRARVRYGGSRDTARRLGDAARSRPTVVLLVDALRADRVTRGDFPNFTRLAGESLHFRNAYAPAASTARSVPAMVTGLTLPTPSTPSVMQRLRTHGRTSALVTLDCVADAIDGTTGAPGALNYPFRRDFDDVALIETRSNARSGWGGGLTTPMDAALTDRAFALLDSAHPPDLLWVHYFDLHQWIVREGLAGIGHTAYDVVLRETDAQIARWLARADAVNLVLVADHGEGLGDDAITTHTGFLTASLVRVPWLVRIPGIAHAPIDAPVTTSDLAQLLLIFAGAPLSREEDAGVLGLVGSRAEPRASFGAYETDQVAFVEGRYRAVFDRETGARWLFDVLRDPQERHSLAAEQPERARAMIEAAVGLRALESRSP